MRIELTVEDLRKLLGDNLLNKDNRNGVVAKKAEDSNGNEYFIDISTRDIERHEMCWIIEDARKS